MTITHSYTSIYEAQPTTAMDSNPPSSPIFRTPSKKNRPSNKESPSERRNQSVVDNVVSDRKDRSMNAGKYTTLSSPLANLHHKESQTRKMLDIRSSKAEEKAMRRRGGLEQMENLVMNSEKATESANMRRDADENTIPAELAENLEKEQQEEMELYDEDLIQFIERRDVWERELEEMMAEFSVK